MVVEAWLMPEEVSDGALPNKLEPNQPVSLEELEKIGVLYFPLSGVDDPKLKTIREERGYSYEDEVCLKAMLAKFYEEHIHDDEEIRLCVEGSGYFDVRNGDDKWVRIELGPGDMIILPAGIYHRFTLDTKQYIKARRYFIDEPIWTPFNRPADERVSRKAYLEKFSL